MYNKKEKALALASVVRLVPNAKSSSSQERTQNDDI